MSTFGYDRDEAVYTGCRCPLHNRIETAGCHCPLQNVAVRYTLVQISFIVQTSGIIVVESTSMRSNIR